MAYNQQTGFGGSNTGKSPTVQEIGAKIAGNQGGVQYESRPGASLSGGVNPERKTASGNQEPGYEHISAPSLGGGPTGGIIESSGGPTYDPNSLRQQGAGSAQPYGQGSSNIPSSSGTSSLPAGTRPETNASIGGAGVNKDTTGGTSGYQQPGSNVQRTVEPYVAQAKEAAAPYVQKVQEVGGAALESARPLLNQAADVAAQAGQVASEKATQAYNVAATELDARGVNRDTTQQKLAEVGQTMKDYGAVGQQRAGEYLQQAVDQAKTIGQDRENKSIVATIFGTVFLVWLAFGFSIGAVFALGVAGSIAAVLSRYSRGHDSGRSTFAAGQQSHGQGSAQLPSGRVTGTTSNLATPGVETHYPRPAHPDNSLNANVGK